MYYTRRRATPLLPTWICSCQSVGTVNFTLPLRKAWRFEFPLINILFLRSNIPSSPAYGDFISQIIRYTDNWSSYECFNLRLHTLSKLYDVPVGCVPPPYFEAVTLYWSGPYYRIWLCVRFHRPFATGAACQQRTRTPPNTWSCPTLRLACVLMSRPISPELVLFTDFWVSNIPWYFWFA